LSLARGRAAELWGYEAFVPKALRRSEGFLFSALFLAGAFSGASHGFGACFERLGTLIQLLQIVLHPARRLQ
jgi:hypothetical protein